LPDLRDFLTEAERNHNLVRIKKEVSPRYEAAAIIKHFDNGPIVYLENIIGHKMPAVGNVTGNKQNLYRALKIGAESFYERVLSALRTPTRPKIVQDGPVKQLIEEPRLTKLPILTHYEKEPGPYINSSIVFARSPDGKIENASVHRLMVLDDKHAAIRIVPRHLYRLLQMAKQGGKPLDVSVTIGVHPAVMVAAASPPPFGVSEFDVANSLMDGQLKLIQCETVDAFAPSEAEIVLEGRILADKTVLEGPYVDLLGTYDAVRNEPVVEFTRMLRRRDAVYHALLAGGSEHKILMGVTKEAKIWEVVRNVVPRVTGVNMSNGGCGWLHAIVSVEKQTEGDGKNVILAAFAAHPSLKHVFVVDSDIDVNNPEEVEWAMATRFRGDRDILVIPNARGSSLDPVGDPATATVTKVGFDLTRPFTKPKESFEKGLIPNEKETVQRILGK